ncbi:MAG: hypothetical protein U0930_24635 [Pirellulales bacterium]
MYESKNEPLLSNSSFAKRVAIHIGMTIILLVFSLALGISGYVLTEGMSVLDAFLNSAMLLGGMGPVDNLKTTSGKLFAGFYALYAGLLFVICAGLVLSPVLHRVLHYFHVTDQDDR